MATAPQGFNDVGNNVYESSISIKTKNSSTERYKSRVNNKTGNIDLYYPTSTGDKLFYRFDSNVGKWEIPKDSVDPSLDVYTKVIGSIGEPGSVEFEKLLSTSKLGSEKVISTTSSEEDKQKILEKEGYKSLANKSSEVASPNSGSEPKIDADKAKEEINTEVKNAKQRTNYSNIQYPLDLKLENQDCIKFSIIQYLPPGLTVGRSQVDRVVKLDGNRPTVGQREILGTITLPIPAGITDRNPINWNDDSLSELQDIFGSISMQTILGGGGQGKSAVVAGGEEIMKDKNATTSVIASKATDLAVGGNSSLQRQFGAITNANLELLFNNPSIRSFSFNFRFTPRQKRESVEVRKIIRYFKQSMSAKRTPSALILKAPHTFAISYLSKNTEHPYLNKFKECALTECSVNYTPDGTYMTYEDSSMTCYELSLSFQELEPIFDDDYTGLDTNEDTTIGF